jgi:hypothetical protein
LTLPPLSESISSSSDLPAVVKALAAQEHHLVIQEGLADLGDRLVAQRRAGVRAGDLGTDLAGQPGDSDVRGRGEGFGHEESAFQLLELGREKDQSAYPGGFAGAGRASGGSAGATARADDREEVDVAAPGAQVARHIPEHRNRRLASQVFQPKK